MSQQAFDWSYYEREIECALVATEAERSLQVLEIARQLYGCLPEEMRILTSTTREAAAAMRDFVDAFTAEVPT